MIGVCMKQTNWASLCSSSSSSTWSWNMVSWSVYEADLVGRPSLIGGGPPNTPTHTILYSFISLYLYFGGGPHQYTLLSSLSLYCIFMSSPSWLSSTFAVHFCSNVTFFCLNRFFPKTQYYCLLMFDNVYGPTRQWANRQANQKGIASKTKPVNIWHIVFFESKLSSSKILLCFSQP